MTRSRAVQAQTLRLERQRPDVARQRVVASSQCMSTSLPRSAAISQSSLTLAAPSPSVRSKCGIPPTTSTPRSSARFRLSTPLHGAQHAVLRERDELQIEVGATRRLTSSKASTASRFRSLVSTCERIASKPLGDGPVAIGEGALDDGVGRQRWFQLAPQRDALEQRAARIDARQAIAQRRVHVKAVVDEGGDSSMPPAVDRPFLRVDAWRDFGDPVAHGDGHAGGRLPGGWRW